MENGSKKRMCKDVDIADNMNYVDPNRNRGAYSSKNGLTQSLPFVVHSGDFSKTVQYLAPNGIPGYSDHSNTRVYTEQVTDL